MSMVGSLRYHNDSCNKVTQKCSECKTDTKSNSPHKYCHINSEYSKCHGNSSDDYGNIHNPTGHEEHFLFIRSFASKFPFEIYKYLISYYFCYKKGNNHNQEG